MLEQLVTSWSSRNSTRLGTLSFACRQSECTGRTLYDQGGGSADVPWCEPLAFNMLSVVFEKPSYEASETKHRPFRSAKKVDIQIHRDAHPARPRVRRQSEASRPTAPDGIGSHQDLYTTRAPKDKQQIRYARDSLWDGPRGRKRSPRSWQRRGTRERSPWGVQPAQDGCSTSHSSSTSIIVCCTRPSSSVRFVFALQRYRSGPKLVVKA